MHDPTHVPARSAPVTPIYLAIAGFLARYGNVATREQYAADLRFFVTWCDEHALDPLVDVRRGHIELFGRHLELDRGNGPATLQRRLGTLKSWYFYLEVDGTIEKSPATHIRRPKVWQDDVKTLGLDRMELGSLLQVARAHPDPTRWALVALMGMLGLRVSEACNVQIEDWLNREERGHRVLTLVGKGNKPATIPLPVQVTRALEAAAAGRTQGPLLRRQNGEQLDRRTADRWVKSLAKRAGIHKRLSPHSLRHAYVTNALDAGVPLRDVQYGARHSDPRTTVRYDRARANLDRHANHFLAAYIAGAAG
jgi:integrase/recombinase XerD